MTLGTRVAQTESAAGEDEAAGLHGAKLRARKSGGSAPGPAGARSQPPPLASHCWGAWGWGCPWGPQQPGQEPGCVSHPGTRSNRPLSTRAARRYGTSWVLPSHTRLWDAPSQALSSLSVMQNAALQHRSPSLQQDQALGTPPSLLLLGAAPLGRAGTSSSSTSRWQLSGCRLSHWVSDTAGDVQPPSGPQNRLFMETNDPFPQQNLNSEPKALGSDPLKFFLVACVA